MKRSEKASIDKSRKRRRIGRRRENHGNSGAVKQSLLLHMEVARLCELVPCQLLREQQGKLRHLLHLNKERLVQAR